MYLNSQLRKLKCQTLQHLFLLYSIINGAQHGTNILLKDAHNLTPVCFIFHKHKQLLKGSTLSKDLL